VVKNRGESGEFTTFTTKLANQRRAFTTFGAFFTTSMEKAFWKA
jgi:hypothetical protein